MTPFNATHKFILSIIMLALTANPNALARTLLDQGSAPLAPLPSPIDAPLTTSSNPPMPNTTPLPITTTTATGGAHTVSFFLHDVIGGTHATARAVTGIAKGVPFDGHLPFGKSIDFFPPDKGVALPGANGIGRIDGHAGDNQPFVTGLGGIAGFQPGTTIGDKLPFVNGGQVPVGATLGSIEFGTITVIDDPLTQGQDLGSDVVGKAQGFYLASSQDGSSQTLTITALLGEAGDSISFFGVHRTAVPESHIAIIGGTGQYANAKGYATVQALHPANTQETDGIQTVLHFLVYVS